MIESDYNRYFSTKMVALLINVSEAKDNEHYESLSGTIISTNQNTITMRMPYTIGLNNLVTDEGQITYKLMSEVMGVGVQVLADLTKVENDVVHLRLRGNIEIFQRRQSARVDTTIRLYQFIRNVSMESYRIMCRRLTTYIESSGVPSEIEMEETAINLSVSGLRCAISGASGKTPSPLSMFLLDLGENRPLICTLAELIWAKDNMIERVGGYRFIMIRKKDRDLIARYVRSIAPLQETQNDFKKNWELLDRMFSDKTGSSETT